MDKELVLVDVITQTCDARELHKSLGNETCFNDWIARRIAEYGFEEEQDYTVFDHSALINPKLIRVGDRRGVDYSLSIEMAKQLAMIERTQTGRDVRQYLIDAEKEFHARRVAKNRAMVKRYEDRVERLHHDKTQATNLDAITEDALQGYHSGNLWTAMAFFEEKTREVISDHKTLLTGTVAGESRYLAVMMLADGIAYMDGPSLARLLGVTVDQIKRLTITNERLSFDGVTLYSLAAMPEPRLT